MSSDSKTVTDIAYRHEPVEARQVLQSFWPGRGLKQLASVISRSIAYAHSQSDACWSVTLFQYQLTLNVGQIRVLDADEYHLTLYLEGPTGVPQTDGISIIGAPNKQFYAALDVPSFRVLVDPDSLKSITPAVLAKHHRLIASAAAAKRSSPFRRSYSPGAVQVMMHDGGQTLAHPAWYDGAATTLESPTRTTRSAFGLPEDNPVVEAAAVDHVTKEYRQLGWSVKSVEDQNVGYDLLCSRDTSERHIEVKGLSGGTCRFVITANEHDEAYSNPHWRLAVVNNALSGHPQLKEFTADAYQKKFTARPLSYVAEMEASNAPKRTKSDNSRASTRRTS